jgi:hypothetical protein
MTFQSETEKGEGWSPNSLPISDLVRATRRVAEMATTLLCRTTLVLPAGEVGPEAHETRLRAGSPTFPLFFSLYSRLNTVIGSATAARRAGR